MPKKPQSSRGRPAIGQKRCKAIVESYRSQSPPPSLRTLAKSHQLSTSTISRILKDAGIVIASTKASKTEPKAKKPSEAERKTLKDVARAAGVSVATASRAMKGSGLVSPDTIARVEKAARKLNYQMHPHVSTTMAAVRAGKIKPVEEVIAYLFSSFSIQPNWKEQIKLPYGPVRKFEAAKAAALRKGYKLEPFDFVPTEDSSKHLERMLYARGIRGLILDVPAFHTVDMNFDFRKFNTVTFREQWQLKTHVVGHNHFLNMLILFSRLWQLGYRRIGLVSSDASSTSTLFRRDAGFHHCQYHLVPKELRIPILHFDTLLENLRIHFETGNRTPNINRIEESEWLWQQDWSSLKTKLGNGRWDEKRCLLALLEKWIGEFSPEVVIWEDMAAIDLIEQLGLRVPDDIAIAHSKLNSEVDGWSGLRRADEEIATIAVDQLIGHLQLAEPAIPKHPIIQRVSGDWVAGNTTTQIKRPIIPLEKSAKEWIEKIQLSN